MTRSISPLTLVRAEGTDDFQHPLRRCCVQAFSAKLAFPICLVEGLIHDYVMGVSNKTEH